MEVGGLPIRDAVVFAVHGILGVVSLLGIWRSAVRTPLLRRAALAVRATCGTFCSWRCAVDDDLAVEVEKRIRKDKVAHMRWFCQALGFLVLPMGAVHMYKMVKGEAQDTLLREVVTFVAKGVYVAALWRPNTVNWYVIDAVYGTLLLCTALLMAAPAVVPDAGDSGDIAFLLLMNVCAFLLSVARRDTYIVAPANVLFALSACLAIWKQTGSCVTSPRFMMGAQCAASFLVSVLSHVLDEWCRATVYENLQMKAAKQLLAAATALLKSYCDMVVAVDSEGTIMGPAQDLGSFLLRGPSYSLQGYTLMQLMVHDEDRRAFLAFLQAHREEGGSMADAIHVRMRDANNTVLNLQLLLFRFTHVDSTTRYMVGIRGNFPALGERQRDHEGRGQEALGDRSPVQASLPSIIGARMTETEAEDAVSQLSVTLPAVLVVDAHQPGFRIRECSAGFRSRIGRLPPSTPLVDTVKRSRQLVDWLGDTANCALYRMPVPADHTLTFYMPHGQVTAVCKVLKIDDWYDGLRARDGPPERSDEEAPEDDELLAARADFRQIELGFSEISHRLGSNHQPRWRLPSSLTSL